MPAAGLARTSAAFVFAFAFAVHRTHAASPQPTMVVIGGYTGDVMEPVCSPSGDVLLYNTRNAPGDHPLLRWATRNVRGALVDRGPIAGAESAALTGVPSIDRARELFFISPRNYDRTIETIYIARFVRGQAYDVRAVPGLASPHAGIVRFDADISPDGQRLLVSEGTYDASGGPYMAKLELARRNGETFAIDPASERIFASVNASGLDYAGTTSADQRVLYFTRDIPGNPPQIWKARRNAADDPFGPPQRVDGLGDYVEAPAFAPGGHLLYFHRRVGADRFALYATRI